MPMPEPREHASNSEAGHMLDLPLGGLLSELLASEGVDPADLAGSAAEARPEVEPPPAADLPVEDSPLEAVSLPGAGIAMPGLLADLMHLAQAADADEDPVQPGVSAVGEPVPEAAALEAAIPAEPLPDFEEIGESHDLAIPGLLALLGAEDAPEEAVVVAAVEPDIDDGVIVESGARPIEEFVAAAMPVAEEGSVAAESELDVCDDLDLLDLVEDGLEPADQLDEIAQPDEEGNQDVPASLPAVAESDATEAATSILAEPDEEDAGEACESADAAAALAEAAGSLLQDLDPGYEQPKQAELANLIEQIDSEIAAAPSISTEVADSVESNYERFVVFRLGGNSYGLHMKLVREVEKAGRVTAVPGAPALLCGLINLRGEIMPLIDPKPLLGLEPAGWPPSGYLVVVQTGSEEMQAALLVEELGGVALVDPASVAIPGDSPDEAAAEHLLGQAQHRGRTVLLLDHRRLLTAEALMEAVEG
jgi:chemotaxis signal transduction protein